MSNGFFRHRVAKNAIGLFVVQAAGYLAPLLVLPYLARVLGIETFGVVAFTVGIVQISSVLLDLGFSLSATQKISVWRDRKQYVARLVGAIFVIKFAAMLLAALGIVIYALTTRKYADHTNLFLLSLLPLLGQCFQPTWFFSGIEKMRNIAVLAVISRITYAALIVMLVSSEHDYLWVPVADGVAQLAATILGLGLLYRLGYVIALPRYRDVTYAIKMTAGVFASRTAVSAYQASGVLLLGLFGAPAAVAVYSLADQFYRAIQQMFAPVILAVYPYMAREKNVRLLAKMAMVIGAIAAVCAFLGYLSLPVLLSLFLDANWDAVIPVFDVLVLAITVNVVSALSGYPLAAALGNLKVANTSVVYGGLLYVVLALVLVLRDRATPVGFAWLLLIAEIYVLLHRVIQLWPQAYRLEVRKVGKAAVHDPHSG